MNDLAENSPDEAVREDLADRLKFVRSDLAAMGDSALNGEWGFCCDVMEPIPEEIVDRVLETIAVRSENEFFNISDWPRVPLHLTVRDAAYWVQRLDAFARRWTGAMAAAQTLLVCRGGLGARRIRCRWVRWLRPECA